MYERMGLKIDSNYKTINDVYWRFFISNEEMKNNNEMLDDMFSMTGGDKETYDSERSNKYYALEQVMYILLVVIIMIVIIGIINDVIGKLIVNKHNVDVIN